MTDTSSPAGSDVVGQAVDVGRGSHQDDSFDLVDGRARDEDGRVGDALVGITAATKGIVEDFSSLRQSTSIMYHHQKHTGTQVLHEVPPTTTPQTRHLPASIPQAPAPWTDTGHCTHSRHSPPPWCPAARSSRSSRCHRTTGRRRLGRRWPRRWSLGRR